MVFEVALLEIMGPPRYRQIAEKALQLNQFGSERADTAAYALSSPAPETDNVFEEPVSGSMTPDRRVPGNTRWTHMPRIASSQPRPTAAPAAHGA